MEKPRILVLSHGSLCTGMLESAKMIGAMSDNIIAIPMGPLVSADEYEKMVRTELEKCPEGSLVLVDFFGGTPFKTVAKILPEYPVYAVAGVNLSMFLECWSNLNYAEKTGRELHDIAIEAGKFGVLSINDFVNDMAKNNEDDEDDDLS